MFPSVILALVLVAVVTQIGMFLTTIYLHRVLAHHSLTLNPALTMVFRAALWVTTGIKPRQWVAVHRRHHAHADEEGDPHSPVLLGYLKVQLGNLWLYRRVAKDPATVARYARDLPPDRWDRMFFDHATAGLAIGIVALCVILGPWLGLIASGVYAVSYLLLSAAVNAIGHLWGLRPYPNLAANSQWLAWITAGEGLHNNHHAAPTSARLSLARGEIDPAWWVISAFERLGWAKIRHDKPVFARTAA
ncbi:MAG TPA: fatty acid desaturase [Acidimicrobiales bacterium]|nr:fatty acid desaturase [Acidimicrobiales bacterium]